MAVQAKYNENDYKNWVQTCLGLQFLKQGIVDYVDTEVQTLHGHILTNVCQSVTCNGCTTDDLTRRRRPCPKNVCDKIRDKLQTEHRYGQPEWNNTDTTRWCTDYWEIAKCFMSKGCKTVTSSADTDTAGLLSVCINGLFMPCAGQISPPRLQPPMDIFHQNREARNAILHSGSMTLIDVDRHKYIQDMVTLLANYKQPMDNVTQDAIQKLGQNWLQTEVFEHTQKERNVNRQYGYWYNSIHPFVTNVLLLNGDIFITPTDEVAALKGRLVTIDRSQKDIERKVDTVQQKVDVRQQYLESKVDIVQQEQQKVDVRQQDLESKVDIVQQEQQKVDVRQQDLESKVDIVQQEQQKVDVRQQYLESKVDIVQQEQQKVDVRQQYLESKVDIVQQEQQKVDVRQQDLESKVATVLQEPQKVDVIEITEETNKNGKSLMILKTKLDEIEKIQNHSGENVSELQEKHRTLQERNDFLIERLNDRVKLLEDQVTKNSNTIQEIKDWTWHTQTITRQDKQQVKKEVQTYVLAKYEKDLSTIPMSPLLPTITATIDDVYTELLIRDDLIHKPHSERNRDTTVDSYQDIFHDGKETCKNIYLVGKAGIGKTTWCRNLVGAWSKVIKDNECANLSKVNEAALNMYDLVFYIELRHVRSYFNITEMIEHQIFPYEPAMMDKVKSLLGDDGYSSRCLIVLDGLDEWVSRAQSKSKDGLPARDPRWKCTFITTTRNWKLAELQLETQKIDRAVAIKGLKESGTDTLVEKVVSTLNAFSMAKQRNARDFKSNCHQYVQECIRVPLMLITFVCLWYEGRHIDRVLAGAFCGLVELLIKYTEGDEQKGLFQKIPPKTLDRMKETWEKESTLDLDCLAERSLCKMYAPFLVRLGKIAFDHLFANVTESTLVFDYKSIKKVISEDELQLALYIGLLSKTTHRESVFEPEFSLAFLHKTVQDFLAALYMVSKDGETNQSFKTFQTYCTNISNVLEMEYILMFVSGLCPELAGKMTCHIAGMERNKYVHKLLLRCARQERAISETSRHIYIKHLFWYSHRNEFNHDTALYLNKTKGNDTTFHIAASKDDDMLKTIGDIRHVKLVEAVFHMKNARNVVIDISKRSIETESNYEPLVSIPIFIRLSGDFIVQLAIHSYNPHDQSELDMTTCKSLIELKYKHSSAPIKLPVEHLEKVSIQQWETDAQTLLDMSRCKCLKSLRYKGSAVPIRLPVESLQNVDIIEYKPTGESTLDMSRCESLKTVVYKYSTAKIILPFDHLEKVTILHYHPRAESVLDISRCKSLKVVSYEQTSVPIKLPPTNLEEIKIVGYKPSNTSVLDLSRCNSLKALLCEQSIVSIHLSSERLVKIVMEGYKPIQNLTLNNPQDTFLRTEYYWQCLAHTDLSSDKDNNVVIIDYKPDTESVFDLSGCESLKTVCYEKSIVPIRPPSKHVEKVVISDYTVEGVQSKELVMSECESLKIMHYCRSTVPIRLHNEHLEDIVITDYTSAKAALLDLSECVSLKTLRYLRSTVPIRLPHENLQEVIIVRYQPDKEPVLDLSKCESLKTLHYCRSHAPILLPSEHIQEVVIRDFKPSSKCVIDISRCKSLRTVIYEDSAVPIRLQSDHLTKVDIKDYKPIADEILDLSQCHSLITLYYMRSTAPIWVPCKCLQDAAIRSYEPSNGSVLDMSECQSLMTLDYTRSSVPIKLPTKRLKCLNIDCKLYEEPLVDLSRCKYLQYVRYDRYENSSTSTRLPSQYLEKVVVFGGSQTVLSSVAMSRSRPPKPGFYWRSPSSLGSDQQTNVVQIDYQPETESVLDLSECKFLKVVWYWNLRVPIRLPFEYIEQVDIFDYKPSTMSILDLSACKSLRTVCYKQSTELILLPTEQLETVTISEYKPRELSLLNLFGCRALKAVYYKHSTAPIRLPAEKLEIVEIENYNPGEQSLLDLSECKDLKTVCYKQSTAPIRLPAEKLENVEIKDYSPSEHSRLDLSGCKDLKTVCYEKSTEPIQLPTEQLENVEISHYNPDDASVLDMSGCKALRSCCYKQSTAPICLPAEHLESVEITDYAPSNMSVLDMSECRSLTMLRYKRSTIEIKLPSEQIRYLETDRLTKKLILQH